MYLSRDDDYDDDDDADVYTVGTKYGAKQTKVMQN